MICIKKRYEVFIFSKFTPGLLTPYSCSYDTAVRDDMMATHTIQYRSSSIRHQGARASYCVLQASPDSSALLGRLAAKVDDFIYLVVAAQKNQIAQGLFPRVRRCLSAKSCRAEAFSEYLVITGMGH